MKNVLISVIIPHYNDFDNLKVCLEAALRQKTNIMEFIVVDDSSNNFNKKEITNKVDKLIILNRKSGVSIARNKGAEKASGDYLLFIDSDVLLTNNLLKKVENIAKKRKPEIIQGIYTKNPYPENFFSVYKNIYTNFMLNQKKDANSLISFFFMIRKNVFKGLKGFNPKYGPIEDLEFGNRCKTKGHKIIVEPKMKVKHLKNYNLVSFSKNQLSRGFMISRYLLCNKKANNIYLKSKHIGFVNNRYLMRIPVFFIFLISLLIRHSFWLSSLLLFFYLYLTKEFLLFIFKSKGLTFFLKSVLANMYDSILSATGICFGFVSYILNKK